MLQDLLNKLELDVPEGAQISLHRLVSELLRWTRRRNLTAITDYDEALEKHIVDSLTMLPFVLRTERLLDLGSGAGFPSLPLKIVCSELEVVSVDAVGKKIDFQKHITRTLDLKGFTAVHSRVESLLDRVEYREKFDIVTARALCSLTELVNLAEPFLSAGGRLVAMKGPEGEQELLELRHILREKGWTTLLHHFVLPQSQSERCLIELSR